MHVSLNLPYNLTKTASTYKYFILFVIFYTNKINKIWDLEKLSGFEKERQS